MKYNMTLEEFLEQLEFCLTHGPPCADCPGSDAYPACADMILKQYKKLKEDLLHELHFANGLYACDNKEGKHLFRLDYTALIKRLEDR